MTDIQQLQAKYDEMLKIAQVMADCLAPFDKELEQWINLDYGDAEFIVEPFEGYDGEMTVGDLSRASDALNDFNTFKYNNGI